MQRKQTFCFVIEHYSKFVILFLELSSIAVRGCICPSVPWTYRKGGQGRHSDAPCVGLKVLSDSNSFLVCGKISKKKLNLMQNFT